MGCTRAVQGSISRFTFKVAQATNSDYEAEKKAEQERKEKAIGVLKYLGQSTIEGWNQWIYT